MCINMFESEMFITASKPESEKLMNNWKGKELLYNMFQSWNNPYVHVQL